MPDSWSKSRNTQPAGKQDPEPGSWRSLAQLVRYDWELGCLSSDNQGVVRSPDNHFVKKKGAPHVLYAEGGELSPGT